MSYEIQIGVEPDWPDAIVVNRLGTSEVRTYEPKRKSCRRVYGGTKYGSDRIVCSECGYGIKDERFNFCPKCGCEIENTVKEYWDER